MAEPGDRLHVTDGDLTMPAVDVLTGRGFVTGKSGSGKSNTASVVVEELLDCDARLLVVDTDGEYYGLKEDYEVLHLGAGDRCDAVVGPSDAGAIVDVALEEGAPVVLDVSGFLDGDAADRLVYEVAKRLFSRARDVRQPFLLLVEEVHEFVPEQGGLDDVGEMLVRVAKRGRKRGLGLCGLSQRPASVDKDFITQCDWLVWHRLTWANDTRVVERILGGSYATDVESLGDGEAFLQADWADDVERVQFRRKRTYDAGATPGFGDDAAPDLRAVSDEWLAPFRDGDDARTDPAGEPPADGGDSGSDESEASTADAASEDADDDGDGSEADAGDAADGRERRGRSGGGQAGAATSDARTAVWELGQLVAYVAAVGARRAASALARGAVAASRAADAGLRALGALTRDAGSRAAAAAAERTASSPTEGGRRPPRSPLGETAAVDRAVGLAVVLVALAVAVTLYAVV
ncbi:ATP-binding protein [Halobacterium yunchengense]|uniref:ATP-binding protein n=1 Tax=Halobacterium yunchengense TaxID=3108497 RepID=UPI00300987FD